MDESGRFMDLFETATGVPPFPYQIRLALDLSFPELLNVPTGLGKTAAIAMAWIWKRRFADPATRSDTPRRLVYCLPMRSLVDQIAGDIGSWLKKLDLSLSVAVHIFMAGQADELWESYPEYDAILIGTQDQFLSRALNRGYGISRSRWPMDFGLLHNDVWWVFDEVQLMGGGGIFTTAQLEAFRRRFGTYGKSYTTWMSATLDSGWLATVDFAPHMETLQELNLSAQDRQNQVVNQRLSAKKYLEWTSLTVDESSAKNPGEYVKNLANLIVQNHRSGTLTLAILNRVNRVQALYQILAKSPPARHVLLLHSRFRLQDRETLQSYLKTWAREDCIIIATQTVEAGVDISARTLITELAPWSSMVQRFGRCNRYGETSEFPLEEAAKVFVVDVDDSRAAQIPYEAQNLQQARGWLKELSQVGPADLPSRTLSKPAGSVLRRRDLLDLFDTTPDLAGLDVDISPFVREVNDSDVQVYWRKVEKDRPEELAWPPVRKELCAVSLNQMKEYLSVKKSGQTRQAHVWVWDWLTGKWVNLQDRGPLPGQVFLLDAEFGGYTPDLGFLPESWEPVPTVIEIQSENKQPEEVSNDDDPRTFLGYRVTLEKHLNDVSQEASKLAASFYSVDGRPLLSAVVEAAIWHDVGKAHPVFQSLLNQGLPENDPGRGQLWAKSGKFPKSIAGSDTSGIISGGKNGDDEEKVEEAGHISTFVRPHFRHELASALTYLQTHQSESGNTQRDLVAYLVASHHGKVRMSLRSFPGETLPSASNGKNERLFARGIWDGDVLPSVTLGDGNQLPEQVLKLEWMMIGKGSGGVSWLDRTTRLLEAYGPFRLAWLEALMRVADWRASEGEAKNHD